MRQIKFEAVDSENNIIRNIGSIEFFVGDKIIVNNEIPVKALRQWTGLLDKNGKEIYEGDIVQWGVHKGEVKWFVNGFVFGDDNLGLFPCNERAEIIGNIYENPELLK